MDYLPLQIHLLPDLPTKPRYSPARDLARHSRRGNRTFHSNLDRDLGANRRCTASLCGSRGFEKILSASSAADLADKRVRREGVEAKKSSFVQRRNVLHDSRYARIQARQRVARWLPFEDEPLLRVNGSQQVYAKSNGKPDYPARCWGRIVRDVLRLQRHGTKKSISSDGAIENKCIMSSRPLPEVRKAGKAQAGAEGMSSSSAIVQVVFNFD